jgi:hypothetical protein
MNNLRVGGTSCVLVPVGYLTILFQPQRLFNAELDDKMIVYGERVDSRRKRSWLIPW